MTIDGGQQFVGVDLVRATPTANNLTRLRAFSTAVLGGTVVANEAEEIADAAVGRLGARGSP